MNYIGFRTDLAMEATEVFKGKNSLYQGNYPPGVIVEEDGTPNLKVTRVKVTSEEGENAIGKPRGNYITLEVPGIREDNFELFNETIKAFSEELGKLLELKPKQTILVIGLGNWNITPDALGPKVVSQIIVTRHIFETQGADLDPSFKPLRPVCALSPGVMGITGIETFEIVRGVVDRVNPDIILIVDSLASRKAERVSTTIQIADTGIAPGSGVGNRRAELTRESLGRPVIAIGVPTVIDAATIAGDAISMILENIANQSSPLSDEFQKINKSYSNNDNSRNELIRDLTRPHYGSLIVTPKEIDEIIKRVSTVIADGINMSLGTLKQ